MWRCIDEIVDRAPRASDLIDHGLHLLAARRWRALGRVVPRDFVAAEQMSALASMMVAPLLERVRAASDLPLVVFKGPELALRYRDPLTRPFGDLDILTSDAPRLQAELIAAGFREIGDPKLFVEIHHLRPLQLPTLPLVLEIHSQPKWLQHGSAAPVEQLIAAAVPADYGVPGISTLPPAEHLLVVAAHSWAHEPLRRLLDIVDVAVLSLDADRGEVDALARQFGIERAVRTTLAASDSLLFGERARPAALRLWARNLAGARGRTVLEAHLAKWIAPFWAYPPGLAARIGAGGLLRDLRPSPDESWRSKLARTARAVAGFGKRRSEHIERLKRDPRRRAPRSGE